MGFDLYLESDHNQFYRAAIPFLMDCLPDYLPNNKNDFPILLQMSQPGYELFNPREVLNEAEILSKYLSKTLRPCIDLFQDMEDTDYWAIKYNPKMLKNKFQVVWELWENHITIAPIMIAGDEIVIILNAVLEELTNTEDWTIFEQIQGKVFQWEEKQLIIDDKIISNALSIFQGDPFGLHKVRFSYIPILKAWEYDFKELFRGCQEAIQKRELLRASY